MVKEELKHAIKEQFPAVVFDEPMSRHTSFKIGGLADVFLSASRVEEIVSLSVFCKEHDLPMMVMGNGSNMLVGDGGIRGVVLQVGSNMKDMEEDNGIITAQCGVLLSALSAFALSKGLTGLEFAGGIPGTLGGALFMNAGAYGGEMKDVVKEVTVLDETFNCLTLPAEELELGYRKSIFSRKDWIILSCKLALESGDRGEIQAKMKDYAHRRAEKQPLTLPSAGSTFKRPEGYFAGKLIQDAGLMGCSVGGAMISEKHAGFVVNAGGATAQQVIELIEYVQKTVAEKFGVALEPEVRLVGEFLPAAERSSEQ